MTESEVLAYARKTLGGNPRIRVFRNNSGVAVYELCARCRVRLKRRWCPKCKAKGGAYVEQFVPYGLFPGSGDLIGWATRDSVARFLSVETKSTTGRSSPEQKTWGRVVTEFGGLHVTPRSFEDVDRVREELTG